MRVTQLDKLFDVLSEVRSHDIREEIHYLRTLRDWAFDQQPFKVGDRVTIAPDYTLERWLPAESGRERKEHSWWPNRECLAPGATATVSTVEFSPYGKRPGFRFGIILDREWTVSDWAGEKRRHERDPEHRHTFTFSARWLRPIAAPRPGATEENQP